MSHVRGKKAKRKVKNVAKDAKYVRLFNHFRKNIAHFTDQAGSYKNLSVVNGDKDLFGWMIHTPFIIQQNTFCAFIRTLRLDLYQKQYLNHSTGKFKFRDLSTYPCTASDAKSVYPMGSGLESNFTTFHQSMNRHNTECRDKWRLENVGAVAYPSEWDLNWKKININSTDYYCLQQEEEKIIDRCELVRGNKNKKAKSMTVETLLALLAFVALLYPMGAEAHNWNGTDLLSATLAHTITLQPGRSATEFCKRSWENDVDFYVDSGGKYCIFREAMNTKTLNTSDANQNRISEKIYQRADRKGLYSLLSEYSKVRPRQSDIDESQKRKKKHSKEEADAEDATLATGYFLQIRGMYLTRSDGSQLMFQNINMGETNVKRLWDDLLVRAKIPDYSLYSARATAATAMMEISKWNLNQISNATGHTTSCVSVYVQKELAQKRRHERDCAINNHQNNMHNHLAQMTQNTNTNRNHNRMNRSNVALPLPSLNMQAFPMIPLPSLSMTQPIPPPQIPHQATQIPHQATQNMMNYRGNHSGYTQSCLRRHRYY
eukprot:620893_1